MPWTDFAGADYLTEPLIFLSLITELTGLKASHSVLPKPRRASSVCNCYNIDLLTVNMENNIVRKTLDPTSPIRLINRTPSQRIGNEVSHAVFYLIKELAPQAGSLAFIIKRNLTHLIGKISVEGDMQFKPS